MKQKEPVNYQDQGQRDELPGQNYRHENDGCEEPTRRRHQHGHVLRQRNIQNLRIIYFWRNVDMGEKRRNKKSGIQL